MYIVRFVKKEKDDDNDLETEMFRQIALRGQKREKEVRKKAVSKYQHVRESREEEAVAVTTR